MRLYARFCARLNLPCRRFFCASIPPEIDHAFVDLSSLPIIERLPGWHGRYFHSQNMTFAHYDFSRGASIHEHFHPEEEVYQVLEGELELTIAGVTQIARAGVAAIVPSGALHSVKALTDGRVLIVDYPTRPDIQQHDPVLSNRSK